ncbi:MAG: hypothetical protein GC154_17935 [bacterium]|nr:hypothetical protein [bacterium]
MKKPEIRIGVIGHGFMGKMHAHACRSLNFYYDDPPAAVTLAGVATHSEHSLQRAMDEWGYAFGTLDYRELCARKDIDVIHCCAPNHLHKDILIHALEHGKHVYMDKPLCLNLDEARDMAAAGAARPDSIVRMAFQYRFVPALLRAKQLIEAGALGRLYSARAAYLHAGYIDPRRPFSWRLDAEKSGLGGALFDLGAHVIDLTRHLLGEFEEVMHLGEVTIAERPEAAGSEVMKPVEVDDVSLMLFRLRGGGVGTLESSRMATGAQDELRFEAHGEHGGLRFNLMQPNFLEYYDARAAGGDFGGERGFQQIESVARYPKPSSLPGPKNTIGWERFHVHAIYDFLSHLVKGAASAPTLTDGVKTQCILHAALESGRTRQWTKVPEIA